MRYFQYRPNRLVAFVGMNPKEITDSVFYVLGKDVAEGRVSTNAPLPTDEIQEVENLKIRCENPVLIPEYTISAPVREGIELAINANVFRHVLSQIDTLQQDRESLRRGELFEFSPMTKEDPALPFYWLLPGYVVDGMIEYNWEQHFEEVKDWEQERGRRLQQLRDSRKRN